MRGRGINYDTGAWMGERWTRPVFDPAVVADDMRVIAEELHCTAVRVTGSDPDRLAAAAGHAAQAGLEVWFAPFLCDLTPDRMRPLFGEFATRAERVRRGGAAVVFVAGAELSLFARGFLPGGTVDERAAQFQRPGVRELLGRVPGRLNPFLADVAATVRQRFGGPVTYASLGYEGADWSLFDYVGADAYRAAHNAATFRDEVRALHRHGLPVAVTEFGCCTFRGAGDRGARGFLIVDRSQDPWRLDGGYGRDEAGQAAYLRELLRIFEEERVDSAFWFTYAGYNFPHHPDPRRDLDLASYGVVRLGPDGAARPKAAFHAMAAAYGRALSGAAAAG